jgi:hypothetical protein
MSVATASSITDATGIQRGIRANLNQFLLPILLNDFVGGMVGLERTVRSGDQVGDVPPRIDASSFMAIPSSPESRECCDSRGAQPSGSRPDWQEVRTALLS